MVNELTVETGGDVSGSRGQLWAEVAAAPKTGILRPLVGRGVQVAGQLEAQPVHAVARLVLPVVERRGAANGLAQVQQGVVAREELGVRDALAGAVHGVALLAVPQAESVRAAELVDQEEASAVLQPGEHRHFVTEVLVNLKISHT